MLMVPGRIYADRGDHTLPQIVEGQCRREVGHLNPASRELHVLDFGVAECMLGGHRETVFLGAEQLCCVFDGVRIHG